MTRPDLSVTTSGTPDHPVLHVSGEMDYYHGVTIAERVNTILQSRPSQLSLDLSGVEFFGSGSVSALVAIRQAAQQTHTDLDLTNAPPRLRRLLELSGVLSLFRLQTSADSAANLHNPPTNDDRQHIQSLREEPNR
jgi:anti-sigma B factor antagonist